MSCFAKKYPLKKVLFFSHNRGLTIETKKACFVTKEKKAFLDSTNKKFSGLFILGKISQKNVFDDIL